MAAEPWPAESLATADDIGANLTNFEPSGAAWDPASGRIWVISDRGELVAIAVDGTITANFKNVVKDPEAVTIAANGGAFVYVGREQPPRIHEIDTSNGDSIRKWTLEELETGADNKRLEGLTFLPDEHAGSLIADDGNPYNGGAGSRFGSAGLFLAGHQESGRIFVYDLDLAGETGAHYVGALGPAADGGELLTDLSGLYFHEASGVLYVLFDDPLPDGLGRIAALHAASGFSSIGVWTAAPGSDNEEGIALIDDGAGLGFAGIVVAEDDILDHQVWLYEDFPLATVTTSTSTIPTMTTTTLPPPLCGDANGDAGITATDALFVLNGAIGLLSCSACTCDVNDSGTVTASDALLVLSESVERKSLLVCPSCGALPPAG